MISFIIGLILCVLIFISILALSDGEDAAGWFLISFIIMLCIWAMCVDTTVIDTGDIVENESVVYKIDNLNNGKYAIGVDQYDEPILVLLINDNDTTRLRVLKNYAIVKSDKQIVVENKVCTNAYEVSRFAGYLMFDRVDLERCHVTNIVYIPESWNWHPFNIPVETE